VRPLPKWLIALLVVAVLMPVASSSVNAASNRSLAHTYKDGVETLQKAVDAINRRGQTNADIQAQIQCATSGVKTVRKSTGEVFVCPDVTEAQRRQAAVLEQAEKNIAAEVECRVNRLMNEDPPGTLLPPDQPCLPKKPKP
jgi:hypothetical protein